MRTKLALSALTAAGAAMVAAGVVGTGSAATASTSTASYQLTYGFDAYSGLTKVVRWAPCTVINGVRKTHVINYKVRTAGVSSRVTLVKNAMARVANATGLRLHYAGTTSYIPQGKLSGTSLFLDAARQRKATGVQLVPAACRLAAGARVVDLRLPPERPPKQWSVKAAVLPFARFAGSDPVLGPEMRSTGEVMASAADLPTALAKAERAAGRKLPHEGAVFLSIRPAEQKSAVPIAATLAGLGFRLYATEGTAGTLAGAGLDVEAVRKLSEADGDELTVIDLIRRGRCDLVINTPEGRNARSDGYAIREAALSRRVPCITTISGAAAAVHAIANARAEQAVSLQERIDAETRTA